MRLLFGKTPKDDGFGAKLGAGHAVSIDLFNEFNSKSLMRNELVEGRMMT
ncbi:hypothetical protein CBM2589_A70284 [Cupriavidus taiwanensis]|uniref:Uncharacterized protein n=1 Tax=Cupriavidus taiwanensis TaxID=164546 RepID=A0A375C7B4_9BURK|nr:hypothetical protein [Cupriavidus taiwanensis]SOY64168.1 hypothetical protein CBM2589_A70284 [Cupriavidus taiwanensis]